MHDGHSLEMHKVDSRECLLLAGFGLPVGRPL